MKLAPSLLRNASGQPISSGLARRSIGPRKASMSAAPVAFTNSGIIGVSVGPGLMQFTRTPLPTTSSARCIV